MNEHLYISYEKWKVAEDYASILDKIQIWDTISILV